MVALLIYLGGKIATGVRVKTPSELLIADVTMLDLAPCTVANILGERLLHRVSAAFSRFRCPLGSNTRPIRNARWGNAHPM